MMMMMFLVTFGLQCFETELSIRNDLTRLKENSASTISARDLPRWLSWLRQCALTGTVCRRSRGSISRVGR